MQRENPAPFAAIKDAKIIPTIVRQHKFPDLDPLARGGDFIGAFLRRLRPDLDHFVAAAFEEAAQRYVAKMAQMGRLAFLPERIGHWTMSACSIWDT